MKYYVKDECYYCKKVTTFYIYTDVKQPYAKCGKCSRKRYDHINALLRQAKPCTNLPDFELEIQKI